MVNHCLVPILAVMYCSVDPILASWSGSDLLEKYAANQDKIGSWALKCEVSSQMSGGPEGRRAKAGRTCEVRWDGARVSSRCDKRQEVIVKSKSDSSSIYLSQTWDGEKYTTYRRSDANEPGRVYISDLRQMDPKHRQWEIESLQYDHAAAVLMGLYPGTLERVDEILRKAQAMSVRDLPETINDSPCHVIEAKTVRGNYTIWIDAVRGFNIAKVQIVRTKDEGHLYYDNPVPADSSFILENVRFQEVQGAWIAVEADYATQTHEPGPKAGLSSVKTHIRISEIALNPDHDGLRSFTGGDIPTGAEVFIVPVTHIRYLWMDGELVTKIDEDAVRQIDTTIDALAKGTKISQIIESAAALSEPNAQRDSAKRDMDKPYPRAIILPRPYCGVYCLYSVLRLMDRDVDFRELVTPEYVGSGEGSSMAELSKAARDKGLFAGVAARLTTRGLSQCAYPAILHVKADFSHQQYDHYELFLGTEDGQAKLFDPPEGLRLVPFRELAPRWDGYALVLADSPFVVDNIFGPDRQRLLLCAALGTLVLFLVHLLKSRISLFQGRSTRRWQLGLSASQAAALGVAALVSAVVYHVAAREGLVANAQATASFQKAYRGGFIRKIGVRQVRRVLGTATILIDARYADDFESGHLKGAISLPIDSTEANWHKITAPIPKSSSVVVYCQSSRCKFGERVASQLMEDGFSNISVFKGGWAEWTAKNGEPARKRMEKENGVEPNGTVRESADGRI